ncbi:MAG: RMD1 family protein [Firmicutes bacterium]|nr:RMD1 family protein [Bacillota bacterium]
MVYSASFNCYKVSLEPNLYRVAEFFKIPFTGRDSDSLVFEPEHVGAVLKFKSPSKFVLLFKWGCICFINFEAAETYRFLKNLESTYGAIDFNLFAKYNENYSFSLEESPETVDLLNILKIYAVVLAKATELKFLADNLDRIYDRAERLVFDLQRGLPKPTSRILKKMTLDIVKIQLTLLNALQILDRPKDFDDLYLKNTYGLAVNTFELQKRFETIQTKISTIVEIIAPYQKLGFNQRETRLLFWEVVLLALFPLSRILDYFF